MANFAFRWPGGAAWVAAVGIALFAVATPARAADPGWWRTGAPTVIDDNKSHAPAENYVPANLGQLKFMAKRAKEYLDAILSAQGGAGSAVADVVNTFEPRAGQGYTPAQIDQFKQANYAPINLGQLKAVAKPFYIRLQQVGYDTRQSLRSRGVSDWAYDFPWNTASPIPAADNYAPANIGQLKWVFSFDLTGFTPIDLPDDWETFYYGSTGHFPLADEDADGTSNIDEYNAGTSPLSKDNPLVQLQVTVTLQ